MLLVQTISETLRPVVSNDWVVYVLLLNMLIMTICKYVFPKNTYALRSLSEYININENQGVFAFVSLLLLGILLGTLFAPIIEVDFLFKNNKLYKIVLFSALLLLLILLKSCIVLFLHYTFDTTVKYSNSVRVATFFRSYLVFLLCIMVAVFYFSPVPKEYIVIMTVVAVVVTRALQLLYNVKIQNLIKQELLYYNILYLCALEILPLLVIIKFLTS